MSQEPIHLPIAADAGKTAWRNCWMLTGVVAAVFIVVIAGIMLGSVFREHRQGLLTTEQITAMKKQLIEDGTDDALKEQIRDADQQLREVYFARRAFWMRGAWLLLGGALVLGVAIKYAADLGYRPFMPAGAVPAGPRLDTPMKLGLGLAGVLLAAFLATAAMPAKRGLRFARLAEPAPTAGGRGQAIVKPAPAIKPAPAVADAAASDEEMAKNWPAFRGAGGIGLAAGKFPTAWDGASRKNIAWSTPIPIEGNNSPVVWDKRLFVSGGTAARREVYCLDTTTGAIAWTAAVGSDATGKVKVADDTGGAPSTMATDGKRVFAIFPTGELVALNFDGKPAWNKSLGVPDNQYGHAASLMLASGVLLVQWDQGHEPKDNLSLMYAFDSATGKEIWKAKRAVSSSWSTPAVVKAGQTMQAIALGVPWVIAYDLKTGKEIWTAKGLDGEVTPSPAFSNNMIYAAQERADLIALKLDGTGDVTKSHMKKIDAEPLPDIVSPVAVEDRLLLVGTSGMMACVRPSDGKLLWESDIEAGFHASPIAAGNLIYLTDRSGVTHIIELGDEFKVIGKNALGEEVNATPAMVNGRIFLRGKKSVFCVEEK